MSVRIKISYETEPELKRVLLLLAPVIKDWRISSKKSGKFLRAYVTLNDKR